MSLGLPNFSMVFRGKGVSAVERSARGIVALILQDSKEGGKELSIYKKVDEVDFENWTEENYGFMFFKKPEMLKNRHFRLFLFLVCF